MPPIKPPIRPSDPKRVVKQPWKCRFCEHEGAPEFRIVDGSLASWQAVIDDHAEKAVGCARNNGAAGIFLYAELRP